MTEAHDNATKQCTGNDILQYLNELIPAQHLVKPIVVDHIGGVSGRFKVTGIINEPDQIRLTTMAKPEKVESKFGSYTHDIVPDLPKREIRIETKEDKRFQIIENVFSELMLLIESVLDFKKDDCIQRWFRAASHEFLQLKEQNASITTNMSNDGIDSKKEKKEITSYRCNNCGKRTDQPLNACLCGAITWSKMTIKI